MPQILRHNARFDIDKLNWLNGEYVRELPDERFHELSVHALRRAGIDTNKIPSALGQSRSRYVRGQDQDAIFRAPGLRRILSASRKSSADDAEAAEQRFCSREPALRLAVWRCATPPGTP